MSEKYTNIGALLEAFRSGELDKNLWILHMDNDCSSLTYIGPTPKGKDADEFESEQYDVAMTLFHGNGYSDIVDLCNAAGIPCEWC